ncbi:alkaline phosphatase (plasmid) [Fulvitalea axinellae]|uniref:Alkaline phosphatase n=1 Tax=Fulvitalea axinellae TaxID=1182444 RepID=A0AAU9CGZ6_9BACT|nr:alkaline phosphatase [Fulvitalea axinellae]
MNYNKMRYTFFILLLFPYLLFAQAKKGNYRIMQGPMIGATSPTSALVWARVYSKVSVKIAYRIAGTDSEYTFSQEVIPEKEKKYVIKIRLKDLEASTEYDYHFLIGNRKDPFQWAFPDFTFKTAPKLGMNQNITVAFGSCARYQENSRQLVWNEIRKTNPDFFIWMGDNIYGDALDPDILAEEYQRQREVLTLRPFLRNVSQLAIWDDHDYGLNNHDRTHPGKKEAREQFGLYWANPKEADPTGQGIYFKQKYANLDFFFLDTRYFRDPNKALDNGKKTMLGKRQLKWLQSELLKSDTPFKVLVSGSAWSQAKGMGGDSWASYQKERNAIFNFIRDNNIEGVVMLSGDTHVAELN